MHNEKTSKKKVPYQELLHIKNVSPIFLMQSLEWFCCSFVKDDSTEQESQLEEVSAFDEEALEEIEQMKSHSSVYQKFQINIKSLKSFYSTVERLGETKEEFMAAVMEMIELISFYCTQ